MLILDVVIDVLANAVAGQQSVVLTLRDSSMDVMPSTFIDNMQGMSIMTNMRNSRTFDRNKLHGDSKEGRRRL